MRDVFFKPSETAENETDKYGGKTEKNIQHFRKRSVICGTRMLIGRVNEYCNYEIYEIIEHRFLMVSQKVQIQTAK